MLRERFEHIRVGVHDDVEVVFGAGWDGPVLEDRRIAQVFTSTFAGGGYSGGTRIRGAVEDICRELLRAAYLGTLLAACALRKHTVVLTMIGGGVFGNPHPLIWDSILWAAAQTDALLGAPLHVVLNGREVNQTLDPAEIREATRDRGGVFVEVRNGRAVSAE